MVYRLRRFIRNLINEPRRCGAFLFAVCVGLMYIAIKYQKEKVMAKLLREKYKAHLQFFAGIKPREYATYNCPSCKMPLMTRKPVDGNGTFTSFTECPQCDYLFFKEVLKTGEVFITEKAGAK